MTTAKEKTDWLSSRISGLTHSCQPGRHLLNPLRLLDAPCRSSIAGCSFAVGFWSERISLWWSRNPSFRSLGRVALANSTASCPCSVEQTAIDCSQVDRLVLPSSYPCTSSLFDRALLCVISRSLLFSSASFLVGRNFQSGGPLSRAPIPCGVRRDLALESVWWTSQRLPGAQKDPFEAMVFMCFPIAYSVKW